MTSRDEFDDPEGFESAFGKIAAAMEQSRDGVRQRGPMIGIAALMVALFVLFAVFWSTYPRQAEDGDGASGGPVPIIRADATPYKSAPDNPGGMEIPYRDSTVFETLRNARIDDGESGRVESLLDAPEEPIDRTQMFAGLKTEPMVTESVANAPIDTAQDFGPVATQDTQAGPDSVTTTDTPDNAPAAVASTVTASELGSSGVPKPEHKPAYAAAQIPEDKSAIVARAEPAAGDATARVDRTATPSGGTHYIQLGSVKDRAGAEGEWKRLQKEFPAQLGSLTLRVQEANLGERGTFYRIQAGALDQASAKEICQAISSRRAGGCIVVSR